MGGRRLLLVPREEGVARSFSVFALPPPLQWTVAYSHASGSFHRLVRFAQNRSVFAGETVCADSTTALVPTSLVLIAWGAFFPSASSDSRADVCVEEEAFWTFFGAELAALVRSSAEFPALCAKYLKFAQLGELRLVKFARAGFEAQLRTRVAALQKALLADQRCLDRPRRDAGRDALLKSLELLREFLPEKHFCGFARECFGVEPAELDPAALNARLTDGLLARKTRKVNSRGGRDALADRAKRASFASTPKPPSEAANRSDSRERPRAP